MDTETVGKTIGMAAALYPVSKGVASWMTGKTSQMREEFRFANEFLSAVSGRNALHPYALVKGYQALAGSTRVTIAEVEYLLSLEDFPNRLKDFVLGYSYVQHLITDGNSEISFRSKFMPKWPRLWRKAIYFLGYIVFAFAALSPFLFAKPLSLSFWVVGSFLALTLPTLGVYAVLSLMAALKLAGAERLVKLQRCRPPPGSQTANPTIERTASSGPRTLAVTARVKP